MLGGFVGPISAAGDALWLWGSGRRTRLFLFYFVVVSHLSGLGVFGDEYLNKRRAIARAPSVNPPVYIP